MDEPINSTRSELAAPEASEAHSPVRPQITLASPDLLARLTAALIRSPATAAGHEGIISATTRVAPVTPAVHVTGLSPRVTLAQVAPLLRVDQPVVAPSAPIAREPAAAVMAAPDWVSGLGDLFDVEAGPDAAPDARPLNASHPATPVMPSSAEASAVSPFAIRPRDVLWAPAPSAIAASAPVAGRAGASGAADPAASTKPTPGVIGAGQAAPSAPTASRRGILGLLRKVVRLAAIALVVWFAATLSAIAAFRFVDPPGSMLMLTQRLGGTEIDQRWVRLRDISPNVVRAVIVSEDGRFCSHWGIDPQEMAAAIERARDGVPRGASTITMQVAKNMFLWPSKSYVRKALELPLTLAIEAAWSKSRILEVYLNVAEWGPGVFGIEAAARHHFAKPAAKLSEPEAALLAVALPNPIQRDAGDPGIGTLRLARAIQARMRSAGRSAACIERFRGGR